ncbi:hypothetical protein FBUS_11753 [Fasciolopsis buskii]|uniref:Uncharacterized protein n=1 Tax=Fasciolopsis buskii TaxID=27845 RepID=A0A8E0RYX5_9TREM|nr:hypothetical protein FBUS_11753 [Fasciolopsis buski]
MGMRLKVVSHLFCPLTALAISHMKDSIMDTIDAVLAQCCRSPSPSNEIVRSETHNDALITNASFTPYSNDCTVPHHAPAIDRMLESAKRRVDLYEQCSPVDSVANKSIETAESPVTEQPLIVDLGPPYDPETEDVIAVRTVPENPKIDILLTGRKLLSE